MGLDGSGLLLLCWVIVRLVASKAMGHGGIAERRHDGWVAREHHGLAREGQVRWSRALDRRVGTNSQANMAWRRCDGARRCCCNRRRRPLARPMGDWRATSIALCFVSVQAIPVDLWSSYGFDDELLELRGIGGHRGDGGCLVGGGRHRRHGLQLRHDGRGRHGH